MEPIDLVVFLLIGAAAGWLAGRITGAKAFGVVGNVIVGVAGAITAGYLLPGLIPIDGLLGRIVGATIGAVIVLVLARFVLRR